MYIDMLMCTLQATLRVLWLMPALQTLFLCFFSTVAVTHWLYSWGLLLPCLMTGQPASCSASPVISLALLLLNALPYPNCNPQ